MAGRKPSRRGGESTALTTGKTANKTAKSPINGAEIPLGAHPGNTGGKPGRSGRPPSALREALRESFEKRIPVLEQIADGVAVVKVKVKGPDGEKESEALMSASPSDRIRAVDLMGKYGVGTVHEVSVDAVRARLRETIGVIRERLPQEKAAELIEALRAIWT